LDPYTGRRIFAIKLSGSARRPIMALRRRSRWAFAGLGVLALGLAAWAIFHKPPAPPKRPPAIPVTVAKATTQDVALSITALGAAQAWRSDTILAQVSGKLLSVNFTEGGDVKAGQVLAEVDPTPYRAAVMQAEGALKRDEALLADARLDLKRYQDLKQQDSIAGQQVDTQAALVHQDEGTVLLDQGALAAAKVNLGWCRIVSPISGRAGVRLVDPGNLVSTSGSVGNTPVTAAATNSSSATAGTGGGAGIVVINQIEPIAVTFTVPEADFQRLVDISQGFRKPLAVKAFSQETGALLDTGELTIADNRVDPATGTIELKARFSNMAHRLWPGQFVNVQLTLQTLQHVITIPVTAENHGPNGTFAFVVGPDGKAIVRPIEVSWVQGDLAVIKTGVSAGETVVTDGQMVLKAGSLVRTAPASLAPKAPSS
jgi:multidrug efflux system membrane fusion protein